MPVATKRFTFPEAGIVVGYLNLQANPADQIYVQGNCASLKHFETRGDAKRWMEANDAVGGLILGIWDAVDVNAKPWLGPAGVPTPGGVLELTRDPHPPAETDNGIDHEKRDPRPTSGSDVHHPRR